MVYTQQIPIPKDVKRLYETFHRAHYELYLVGGAVRDALSGRDGHEYDFATNATPQEVQKLFKRVIPTGMDHGTVTVLLNENAYEITTYREDGPYRDHRHPETVHFSRTLHDDLKRRDFTINGLAYDIGREEVIDLFSGKQALLSGEIKAIGNPKKRFEEDALRLLRACRFCAQLGFVIEKSTLSAMKETAPLIQHISPERMRDELIKIIICKKPSLGFEAMREADMLQFILPELHQTIGVSQNRYHKYDVYYHIMHVIDSFDPKNKDYRLRLSGLFHDIGKPKCKSLPNTERKADATFYNHEVVGARMTKHIMRRLRFSKEDSEYVAHLTRHHMFHYTPEWTDGALRRFIRKVGPENLNDLFLLRQADRLGNGLRHETCDIIEAFKHQIKRIMMEESALKVSDLHLNGHDLMKSFDLKPSPLIGILLNALLEEVLDDPSKNRPEILLSLAETYLKKHSSKTP